MRVIFITAFVADLGFFRGWQNERFRVSNPRRSPRDPKKVGHFTVHAISVRAKSSSTCACENGGFCTHETTGFTSGSPAAGSASLLLLIPLVWRLAALLSREGCRCPRSCLHGSDDDGFDVTRFGWLTRLPQRDGDGTLLRHVVCWPDLCADG